MEKYTEKDWKESLWKEVIGMIPVAICVRVSTPAQASNGRLERQESEVREWCEDKGWNVVAVFSDVCNKRDKDCPGMVEALAMADKFNKIVAVSLDRFGDKATAYHYYIKFRNEGVGLVAIKEDVDSQEDWMKFTNTLYGLNIEERDRVRKLVTKRGRNMKIEEMIKAGKKPSLKPTFGLKHEYDSTIAEVREIFQLYLYEHKSTGRIAEIFNVKGQIKSPEGGEWTAPTIHNILRNEVYTEETEIGIVPISKYEFERVQKRLKITRGGYGKHVLSRIVYCIKCNEKMYLRNGKYYCRKCGLEWDRKKLELSVYVRVDEQFREALKGVYKWPYCKSCDPWNMRKIETRLGIPDEDIQRLTRNWIPVELGKRVLVGEEGIVVEGLSTEEASKVLNMGAPEL